jgi:two-component system response regulator DevR
VPRAERRARVVLLADHEIMRVGLRALLEASRLIDVVADADTVAAASLAAAANRPALVLVATPLADDTWIDGCRRSLAGLEGVRVVILADHADEATAMAASRAAAVGCLSRHAGAQRLCRALRELAIGDGTSLAASASPPPRSGETMRDVLALTTQERRVLRLVADGKTNREIGFALGLSTKTVKNYLSHAFEKLNVSRRAQAAVLFVREHGRCGR